MEGYYSYQNVRNILNNTIKKDLYTNSDLLYRFLSRMDFSDDMELLEELLFYGYKYIRKILSSSLISYRNKVMDSLAFLSIQNVMDYSDVDEYNEIVGETILMLHKYLEEIEKNNKKIENIFIDYIKKILTYPHLDKDLEKELETILYEFYEGPKHIKGNEYDKLDYFIRKAQKKKGLKITGI